MLTVTRYPKWSDQATEGLGETVRDDLKPLQQQVNQGIAQLWQVDTEKGQSWLITRVEQINDQKELVVCCYKGCDVKTVTDVIYQCAVAQGFDSIRYHTQRQGLNRLVVHLGFTPYETIYRKVITNSNQL